MKQSKEMLRRALVKQLASEMQLKLHGMLFDEHNDELMTSVCDRICKAGFGSDDDENHYKLEAEVWRICFQRLAKMMINNDA